MCFFANLRATFLVLTLFLPVPSFAQTEATNQSPSNISEQIFDDWVYRCAKSTPNGDGNVGPICEISQSVLVRADPSSDQFVEVLNVALSRARDKANKVGWALAVLTPLDVHLASDFGLKIGKSKAALARYRNCTHQGCWVVLPVDSTTLASLKKSQKATAGFQLITGQDVNVSFSLMGFTKAFSALQSQSVPVPEAGSENDE